MHEDIWIIANILSSAKEGERLFPFYMSVRRTICGECHIPRDSLLDAVALEYDQVRDIMREVFGEKFPLKIPLIKSFEKKKVASSLLSVIVVDWLTNLKPEKQLTHSPAISKPVSTKEIKPQSTNATTFTNLKTTRRDLSTKSATNLLAKTDSRTPKGKNSQDKQLRERLNNLNKEKLYLLRTQEETEYKIQRIRTLNSELVGEYNDLFQKGRTIYNTFFEIFYALKIQTSNKFAKFPVKDDDLNQVKKFLNFSKLDVRDVENANANPMINVLRSRSAKTIRSASSNTNRSKVELSKLS